MKPLEKFRKDHLGTVRVTYDGLFPLPNMFCSLMIVKNSVFYSWMLRVYELYYAHGWLIPLCPRISQYFFLLLLLPLYLLQAERKKYEKETEKYYSSLEKLLNMSAKKKEPQLQEVFILAWTLQQQFIMTAKRTKKKGILFSLRIPVFVFFFVFGALGNSLAAKPVGLCEFPLTCLAGTVFLACLERKCVLTCAVLSRSKLVTVVWGASRATVPWHEHFKLWRIK